MSGGSFSGTASPGPRWGLRFGIGLAVVVLLAGAYVAAQLERAEPGLAVSQPLAATVGIGASATPRLPWPAQGSAAVEVLGVGSLGSVRDARPLPLASITKLMTALVVLARHPLAPGAGGPTLTITRADVATYRHDLAGAQSVLAVRAGERLDERQALEALLVPSANNIALALARWDAGSTAAFVARMNARAAALGLHHTRFVEPSGIAPGDAATATDVMRLGADALANRTIASIVGLGEVVLPVAGTVINYDYLVGHHGIVGIKTGSSNAAGGDFVFAARRSIDGKTFTAVGVVLHQEGTSRLDAALAAGERLAVAALARVRHVTLLRRGETVVRVRAPWSGATVAGTTVSALRVFALSGSAARVQTTVSAPVATGRTRSVSRGERLALVTVELPGQRYTIPALASGALAGPSLRERLTRV